MKKLFLAVICAAAVFALRSETLEINGKFENVNKKTGRPANWNLNSWVHYKPAPKIEVTAAEGESAVLHISDIKGKRGAELFCATPIPAAAGDTVTITVVRYGNIGSANSYASNPYEDFFNSFGFPFSGYSYGGSSQENSGKITVGGGYEFIDAEVVLELPEGK